jgi:hypothetical protein
MYPLSCDLTSCLQSMAVPSSRCSIRSAGNCILQSFTCCRVAVVFSSIVLSLNRTSLLTELSSPLPTHPHRSLPLRAIQYTRTLYLTTGSDSALREMHALCALLSVRAPDAATATAAVFYQPVYSSSGSREGESGRIQGEGGEESSVPPDLTVLSALAVLLPPYIRHLPAALTPAPVPIRNMVHLLSCSWDARQYCRLQLSTDFDTRSVDPGSASTEEMGISADAARDIIVAWAVALSLPCSSSSAPSTVPVAAVSSLCRDEISKIITYFQSFDKRPKSSVPLDRYCCYSLSRISDIIVPCLQKFLSTARAGRQHAGEERARMEGQVEGQGQGVAHWQGQDQAVPADKSSAILPHSCPPHPLCDTLLGPEGDDCWGRVSSQVFVRLAVTIHTYAMRRY